MQYCHLQDPFMCKHLQAKVKEVAASDKPQVTAAALVTHKGVL